MGSTTERVLSLVSFFIPIFTYGGQHALTAPTSLKAFLVESGYDITRIVVELNLAIVPKADYDKTILNDGDSLEIVHFVGGG